MATRKRAAWGVAIIAALALVSIGVSAQVPFSGSWSVQELLFLPLSGGTVTGSLSASDQIKLTGVATTTSSGLVLDLDRKGITGAFPTTDTGPTSIRLIATQAGPLGTSSNQTGATLQLAGGEGTTLGVATQGNCGTGDAVIMTVNGNATTCSQDASLNDATHYTCGASSAAMATNIAACLTQINGVDSCAGSGCTLFTGTSGTFYIYSDNSEGAPADYTLSITDGGTAGVPVAVTNGAMGEIRLGDGQTVGWRTSAATGQIATGTGTVSAPPYSTVGDLDNGLYFPTTNQVGLSAGGTAVIAGGIANSSFCIGGTSSSFPAIMQNGGTSLIFRQCTTTTRSSIVSASSQVQSGSAGAPGFLANTTESNTGIYSTGTGALGASVTGAAVWTAAAAGFDIATLQQADLSAGSCTLGQLRLDTGGATKELCYCQASNVWYCWSATTVTGPTD